MGKGKYSPSLTDEHLENEDYGYNAQGKRPVPWNPEMKAAGFKYVAELMFADYDSEGYDMYGYSAYNADGKYVGIMHGVDRWGYTEDDYTLMSDEDYNHLVLRK